ncbi:MAG TPA: hypothetical protein VGK19_07750 [Capsulimonadaceae bacterium]
MDIKQDLPDTHSDREAVYRARMSAAKSDVERYAAIDHRFANTRVAVFAAFVVTLGISARYDWQFAWSSVIPLAVFVALLVRHEGIVRQLEMAKRRAKFYRNGLDRLSDTWAGKGNSGIHYLDPAHPFAIDIDIFGDGSLYELLCTCRTLPGEDTLARWLLSPADVETVAGRQAAVKELADRVELRERIALLGDDIRASVVPEGLIAWGESAVVPVTLGARVIAYGIAAVNCAATAWWFTGHSVWPLIGSVMITALFARPYGEWIKKTTQTVAKTSKALEILALLLETIEHEPFVSALLRDMNAQLNGLTGTPPSHRIKRLDKLVGFLEASLNAFSAPLAFILLWPFQFADRIQLWRIDNGAHFREWLQVAGDFEALCALASFAYENPGATFPAVVSGAPRFTARGLNHPLLPRVSRIANDVSLTTDHPLLIVSGSNMSGKSTLMRTVGVNTVLALAGAPVLAERLELTPLTIGASIRTQDSLQGGISRFYAEITRIRQVVDLAGGDPPLLFLLDEVLHGTNSHDRRIGAEAILRSLAAAGAIGIVTTHDLALAALGDDAALGAVNVHLEDQIVDGKMVFDYVVRPGVVKKSNAIELMRAVGLDV